jgi:hypothetical protein
MTAGRPVGRTAHCGLLLLALLAVTPSGHLAAQMSVHLGVGARYGTPLIRDSIVVPIELRPAIAPTLLLSVHDDLRGPWTADATLDVTPTPLRRYESGTTFDAGSVTTVSFTVGVRRTFRTGITARFAVGGLAYTGSKDGAFRDGSGLMPVGGVAGSYEIRGFAVELRYDVHRFITRALQDMRFNNPRVVHRVALTVSRRIIGKGGAE